MNKAYITPAFMFAFVDTQHKASIIHAVTEITKEEYTKTNALIYEYEKKGVPYFNLQFYGHTENNCRSAMEVLVKCYQRSFKEGEVDSLLGARDEN